MSIKFIDVIINNKRIYCIKVFNGIISYILYPNEFSQFFNNNKNIKWL